MVDALINHIIHTDPNGEIVIQDGGISKTCFSEHADRIQLTPLPKLITGYRKNFRGYVRMAAARASFSRMQPKLERAFLESRPDLVYDVSGYYLSEVPDFNRIYNLVHFFSAAKRSGAKVICLPKSFGPLRSEKLKNIAFELTKSSDVLFCRDSLSFSEMKSASDGNDQIILSCDYTSGVPAACCDKYEHLRNGVAIIPNVRMIDRLQDRQSEEYIKFLSKCAKDAISYGLKPFFLLHQPKIDLPVAKGVNSYLNSELEIYSPEHHREIKGVVSRCKYVVSSRYHGIINALSSGVPVMCTGWSHKYVQILAEHGLENLLIDDFGDVAKHESLLARFLGLIDDENMFVRIGAFREVQNDRAKEMWEVVSDVIMDRQTLCENRNIS